MNDNAIQILILDDDIQLGELLKAYLETSGPFQVQQIILGRDLFPTLAAKRYQLLMLDFQLPDTTGLEILEKLSNSSVRIPVIMMSGIGDQRTAAQAIQRGASEYLIKGEDFFPELPLLIQKTIRFHELQDAARRSIQEAQYQALLLDNMRDAVVVWNLEGLITFWNPAAFVLFGMQPKEMIGSLAQAAYLSLFNPPVPIIQPENTAAAETEREYIRRDGRKIWISSRLMPLRSPESPQQVLGYMDVSRDITHRKQEQQALQESRKFVQKIIDTTPNLIYIFDFDQGNLFINQVVAEMLGYSPEEYNAFSTETLNRLIHPDDIQGVSQARQSLMKAADGTVIGSEFRMRHKNGQWRWLYSRESVFLRGTEGCPCQVIGTSEDITERKQKDAQIVQANAQLMQAARLSAVGQLATGVAHQVSNPLTAILGETQLLLRDMAKDNPMREAIETIEMAGWRAQWAVQILNTYSEPPSNTIGSVDLFESIRMAISLIGINLQSDGVSIQLVLDSEPPKVRGNPRQIEALWVNLLLFIHSIINMRACSLKITAVDLDEGKIAIDTILDGIAVSEAQLNAVFDENLAVTNSSTTSGMEFSICQEIVRQNQGTINVTSNRNYSTLRVILPKER